MHWDRRSAGLPRPTFPLISINSGSDVSAELGALLHVGQEEFDAGRAAGAELKSMGGTRGLCVNHEVGNVALDQRCAGFAEGFEGPVEVLPTSADPAEVEAKVMAALDANPDIDTVLTLSASLAGEPTVSAVSAMGRTGEIRIARFDLSANFLEAVAGR